MLKYLQLLAIFLLFPMAIFAQNNFKAGYIINSKNDTVKGYIDYKEWINNPKSFYFKNSITDNTPQKYSTANAKAFGVTNIAYYQKAIVKISTGSVNIGSLPDYIDTNYMVDTVYLKVVSVGKYLVLYSFSEPAKLHFYLADNGEISELNYYMYTANGSARTVNTFQNQLATIAAIYRPNQNGIIEQIKKAGYEEYDIKSVVNAMNGGENKIYASEDLSKTQFYIGAGVKANKITFNGTDGPFPAGTNSSSNFPMITAGFNFIVNKNTEKLVLRLELAATVNKYNFELLTPDDLATDTKLDIKQVNVAVVPQVIYNFYATKPLKAFVDVGVALNLSFYNNYSYIIHYFDQTTDVKKKYPLFNKGWPSFPLKAGIVLNGNIEIYGSYWLPSSIISSAGGYGANVTSYGAGINFMF